MADNKQTTYWPYMILGFFILGITLGYWTIKSASSMPIQKSNEYMMKYQSVDLNFNEIMEKKAAFDKKYEISLLHKEMVMNEDNIHSNRLPKNSVKLVKGMNHFTYTVMKHNGSVVADANITFLLTRPHTAVDDMMVENVPYASGEYRVKDINITKPGRYTLQLRAVIGDTTGYSEVPAYLEP